MVIEQKPKQAVAEQAVDLKSICRGIEQEMREINQQRTTFALEQINQDLKVCLPLMDFPTSSICWNCLPRCTRIF